MAGHYRFVSLQRLLVLARRLDGARYAPSIRALADEFNVSDRTIRRDLELLESVGCRVPKWRLNKEAA